MMQALKHFNVHHTADMKEPLISRKPVFYTHTLCPYAQRVFLTLLYKEVPFELVQVDLSDKPRWYSSISPQGLVPAVVQQGTPHVESLDICRWLDRAFSSPCQLTPEDAAGRRQMDALLASTSGIVSAGLDLVSGSTARLWAIGTRPSRGQQQRFEQQSQLLSRALQQQGGPFLCGPTASLADIALLPFFERFRLALNLFQDCDLADIDGGAVAHWMDHLHSSSWCHLAQPDPAKFAESLRTHKSLDFFDYTTYSVYQVHPHLQTAQPSQQ